MPDRPVTSAGMRVLDVGAGTGIAAKQLADAGADVLAVEPDERMARIAAAKGICVEQSTHEEWQPASRDFGLVVFAQSFHWVDTRPALEKVAAILRPSGRLAILDRQQRGRGCRVNRGVRLRHRTTSLRRKAALRHRAIPRLGVHLLQSSDARPCGPE